ncbi:MAG: polysaccharide biosynthesis/export family protein [Gemmataceae bacterium]
MSNPLRHFVSTICLFVVHCCCGCQLLGGADLALFPDTSNLLPEAREARFFPLPEMPRELSKTVQAPYAVAPGDVLFVQPASLDFPFRLPADQAVMPDGTISLGEFGRVEVVGLDLDAIANRCQERIRAHGFNTSQKITARVVSKVSKVFYVLGEVNAPGAYPLDGRETVLDGLLAAGGVSDSGSKQNIILARPTSPDRPREVYPVCYDRIVQLGDTTTNYQLFPGDRIYVPSRGLLEELSGWHRKHGPCPSIHRHSTSCHFSTVYPTNR